MSSFDNQPVLSANTRTYVGETAFANDKFSRKQLAEKLTDYLSRLNDGAVLAIDAPWGEGKTWFGKNWEKQLKDDDYKTIYIDAFEQDYIDDTFMLLASEFTELLNDEEDNKTKVQLVEKASQVAKVTLSMGTKIGINLATRLFLGQVNMTEEIEKAVEEAGNKSADITSNWIKDKFNDYSQDKQTIQAFKKELSEYAVKQEKPVIIFVDELDRCKPDFAVSLIERIKHFFDVPNIVFVLLLNREQLEKAVKGVYGSETDASTYLGKFVNFFFSLPHARQNNHNSERKLSQFIEQTMQKYKFQRENQHDGFINYIKFWVPRFNMSLRDIEKAVALYAFAYPTGELTYLLTYLIVLKIKKPTLYSQLQQGKIQAHKDAKKYIEYLMNEDTRKESGESERVLPFYLEWHEAHINGFKEIGEHLQNHYPTHWHVDKKDLFSFLSKKIDLEIER